MISMACARFTLFYELFRLIAQRKLGDIYSKQHDYPKAVKWYRKAANQGQVLAQFQLGLMYANGQGVKRDYTETARWLLKSAEEGYTKAQVFLGYMYERGIKKKGRGIKQDYPKAIKWYRKAAEKGSLMAQTHLSLLYVKNKNYAESLDWYHRVIAQKSDQAIGLYRELAKQGNAEAQFYMAKMYVDGEGVKRDYVKAVKWFRRAAEQGIARAQFNLGEMYANGKGVMQSGAVATDWYYKAGLSYLKEKKRDKALTCAGRIKQLGNIPNAFLANKLLARLYSGKGTAQAVPKAKQHKTASAVSGTGWPVVGGYVVTNHHVVTGHHHIVLVRRDGVKIKVTVVADDATNDLALLKPASRKNLPPALPLSNRPAQVGEQVFTVGYPHPDLMGIEPKLTQGIVNARTGISNDPRTYQISVPLQGGNSGGPLINMRGEVVGVVASKLSAANVFKWTGDMPQNVNYAIKSGYVQILLSSIDPSSSVSVLPSKKDDLAGLAKRIEGSVLMVIAQ